MRIETKDLTTGRIDIKMVYTDCTKEIQKHLDKKGFVALPKGRYLISGALDLNSPIGIYQNYNLGLPYWYRRFVWKYFKWLL